MKNRVLAALVLALVVSLALCAAASAASLPKSISLADTRKVLGMGLGINADNNIARVEAAFKPAGAQAPYRVVSSRPAVVEAVQDEQGWYLRSVSPGTSVITAIVQRQVNGEWVDSNIRHRITVQVKNTVKLTLLSAKPKNLCMKVGESYDLSGISITFKPAQPDCLDDQGSLGLTWSVSNSAVAQLEDGKLMALSKGACKLVGRAPDGSGKKVTISVTVKNVAPQGLTLSQDSAQMVAGDSLALSYTLEPENTTNQNVVWSSSKPAVVSVDSQGNLTALKAGSATITCRSAANSKIKDTCAVVVEEADRPLYRIYAVGNAAYTTYARLPATLNDQQMITGAYKWAEAAGMQVESLVARSNLTGAQLESLLASLATSGADENDVTLFFYSGHGYSTSGALVGVDGKTVSVAQVRAYLEKVPGTVILMLDSCYSGQYAAGKSAAGAVLSPSQYNQMIIQAFASGAGSKDTAGSLKVLTACAATQLSWCWENDYSFFSRAAAQGMGCLWPDFTWGALAADKGGDGQVTLTELYQYVQQTVPQLARQVGASVEQDVQIWPAGDQTVVINRG